MLPDAGPLTGIGVGDVRHKPRSARNRKRHKQHTPSFCTRHMPGPGLGQAELVQVGAAVLALVLAREAAALATPRHC